ncbi:FAD:protein FMN transferase [Sinisalibacter aestuarii]|uniref:FAD:protein FMN transferase n=1 Tax=Sinisalibacter aestuarii TaxID=2949426 RepID=A0ABQ5LYX1_9RHOB|nr:FAD:protein FMN transferase [Sinisalibacter aestuarii]GKY90144.1 FAD:protein FMN transferase [Sinisalibacter aestuarii]
MQATRHPINRRDLLRMAGAATITSLAAPALARAAGPVDILTGTAFTTEWQISLPAGTMPIGLGAEVQALFDGIDRQMSPYRADSDLTRLNTAASGRCALPAELLHVARAALDLAAMSGGRYDPTVGPLVARWGFGPISGNMSPDLPGFTLEPDAIVKDHAGLTLDLCGIAKGYALDELARLLMAAGHHDFFIDLGGEVFAKGLHPEGRAWRVGVEDPRPEMDGVAEVLALTNLAIATSGDRNNGYTLGARRYSHIIDPTTREPVTGRIASVSVLGQDAMHADGWATALMAAGSEAGPELARQNGLSAMFLLRDGAGFSRVTTSGFTAHLA